jgi:hypothetical protein
MKEGSRIKFNPMTKEIEIEGSEKFVKSYFHKIQKLLSGTLETPSLKKPAKKKAAPAKKARKVAKKKVVGRKKVSIADTVLALIRDSGKGITTAGLKEKTGLMDKQIWAVVNKATKQGKIRKAKRGLYVAA